MSIRIKKKALLAGIKILLILIIIVSALFYLSYSPVNMVAGGKIHPSLYTTMEAVPVSQQNYNDESERFQRPSKELPLTNPYSFQDFEAPNNKTPLISKKFESPEDLILAYYGILKEASNMLGYSGGCGTIGDAGLPYPYAYELLTEEKQEEMSLKEFIDSFKGIGHTTLLKIIHAYAPPGTPSNIKYYMVEIEVIAGVRAHNEKEYNQGSQFAYYYGLITVEKTPESGWKIKEFDYIPEDFLCVPVHSWFYLSDAIVRIIYGDNLKIIEKIDKTEQTGNMVYIYASGNGKEYRFDFIRLTNGYDILLHENILENGVWKETSLLSDDWKNFKLTIDNNQFK